MAGWMREDARPMSDAAALWVGSTIPEMRNAGMADCARAHRAGFQRYGKTAPRKAFAAQDFGCGPERQDLCMCSWILQFADAIAI